MRAEESNHDHGGMPQDVFSRVWSTGKITKVKTDDDIPASWMNLTWGGICYSSTEIEDVEYYPEGFVDDMDEEFSVDLRPWDWYKLNPIEKSE